MKKKMIIVSVIVALAVLYSSFGSSASPNVAAPISIDMRTDSVVAAFGTASVRYSPLWTAEDAYVKIEVVNGNVTNVVKVGESGEEGVFEWTPPSGTVGVYKFLLWPLRDSEVLSEPLSAIVSFGISSSPGSSTAVDAGISSLQSVVDAGGLKATYSTEWADDVSEVSISAVRLSGSGGTAEATNMVFSAEADAEGNAAICGLDAGWWRLLFQAVNSSGDIVLEYQTDEFKCRAGLVLCIR